MWVMINVFRTTLRLYKTTDLFFGVKWIMMLILRTVNLSNIVVTSCLVGDLLSWNVMVIILIFFLNQCHEMSRNIWLVFTPYSQMKVTIFHHKFVLNNIYYISQIPVQHKYSTIVSASMNIMSFIIEKDNICVFVLAKV